MPKTGYSVKVRYDVKKALKKEAVDKDITIMDLLDNILVEKLGVVRN